MKHKMMRTFLVSSAILFLTMGSQGIKAKAAQIVAVDAKTGEVPYEEDYQGPQIKKIRLLSDASFLEIYWDCYVDETEAIDVENFVLKNGDRQLYLEPKGTNSEYYNTYYFDKDNKEIAATPDRVMDKLNEDVHMSSICVWVDVNEIDASKGLTLEVKGETIKDQNGDSARSAIYTNIPHISFYTQSILSKTGIVVKSDDSVARESLEKAAEQIDIMLEKTENGIAANMAQKGCSLAVYSPRQIVYHIPEHRFGFRNTMYDVEGYGGNAWNKNVSSIAERNIIRTRNHSQDMYQNTYYGNENILVHEFGHCVKSTGIDTLEDTSLSEELKTVYQHAKDHNLWPNTYCISNIDEFFATISTIWFNVMDEAPNWYDGVRGPVNTRKELKQYDPDTYAFFEKVYDKVSLPAPWDTDIPDRYHVADYEDIPEEETETFSMSYEDVSERDWYYEAVLYNYKTGIMKGLHEKQFGPNETLARAQLAVILWRMEGAPKATKETYFADVRDQDEWYYDAVMWAAEEGIVTGYQNDQTFRPAKDISRQELAVMIYRYAKSKLGQIDGETAYHQYPDASAVAVYAEDAMCWAVGNGIITGINGHLLPEGSAVRAQAATIIMRYREIVEKKKR